VTPENKIKNLVSGVLMKYKLRGDLDFFWVHSTGIYDPRLKRFRARNSKYDRKGIADICVLLRGAQSLWIEIKTDIGKQSPEQIVFEKKVHDMGHFYFVARSAKQAEGIIERLLANVRKPEILPSRELVKV
jgi:hypothetical protein